MACFGEKNTKGVPMAVHQEMQMELDKQKEVVCSS
jgi:hypothetical protein